MTSESLWEDRDCVVERRRGGARVDGRDVMAAGSVVEDKAILFKKANDLARLDGGELRHHLLLYQLRIP